MDEKRWILRNCKFAQMLPGEQMLPSEQMSPEEMEAVRSLFTKLTKDPKAPQYTKADVTRSMRELGFDNPLMYPDVVEAVMGMLGRWYQRRDEQSQISEPRPPEPNVGKIGQPPIPGRGY